MRDLRLIGLSEQTINIAVVVLHEVHGSCLVLILMYIGCGVVSQPPPRRTQMTCDRLELLLPLQICLVEKLLGHSGITLIRLCTSLRSESKEQILLFLIAMLLLLSQSALML